MRPIAFVAMPILLVVAAVAGGCRAPGDGALRSGAPARGATIRLAITDDIKTLDPAHAYDTYSTAVVHALCTGLVDYDDGTRLVPDLASRWEMSADGREYRFTLRPGIRFSNGEPVTAAAFKYSLERVLRPETGSNLRSFFAVIEGAEAVMAGSARECAGIQAPAPDRLILRLKKPTPTFLNILAMTCAAVVPRSVAEKAGRDFARHPVGVGPYRLRSWEGSVLELERNPFYTGDDTGVRQITLETQVDEAVLMPRYEARELDVTPLIPAAEMSHVRSDPQLKQLALEAPVSQTWYLGMNTRMKPFDDVRVRQAVNYAVDRERQARLPGAGVPATGMLPPTMPGYNPRLKGYPHDPERARQLLRQAGYPAGFRTTMWITDAYRRRAEAIQEDLRGVGIQVELRSVAFGVYADTYKRENGAPCWYGGWYPDYPDPSSYLEVLFHSRNISPTGALNATRYQNPEVDRLLDLAERTPSGEPRLALYRQAEEKILADAPVAPLYYEVETRLRQPEVEGAEVHPVWRYLRLARLRKRPS
ncbi:MAG: ABC transporter substrate-binding protein [Armatimonadetes bacterium]|nr:ABC transporter substrate-binding protein [Armatimonadota bacterium]